jgi:uncharacterized protein (TIGR02996 family)
MGEEAFLQSIHEAPKDDTLLLVYADWLEERGDDDSIARAEFLRVTVEYSAGSRTRGQRKARRKRLQHLAAVLDTDWLAVVSRLAIESCQGKRAAAEVRRRYPIRFDYQCDRRWEDLSATSDKAVRFCDSCLQNVHYCDTIIEAREHARAGHCIAVDLGVIRREGDLGPQRRRLMLGRIGPAMIQREQELLRPDPVSAERIRKKGEETDC